MTPVDSTLSEQLRDRYVIERELGRGGMATVYLARDLRHKRPVALKVLHPELAASLGPERFQREIETAARLQHPHILSVIDSGETAGRFWFTMPYVEGESLRDRLRREKQLPLEEALRIGREAAQALQYAHAHGVIHRDVKPENLLLTEDGSTLVADFGVARALQSGEEALTQTGLALGTPAYMSPEQASGARDLDARSDLYALATVLYEMLAGEPPFVGPTVQALIARRLTEAPRPLRQVRETVPEAVEQAVAKALAKAPADRFPSAAEFARALAAPVLTAPVPTTTVPAAPVRAARHRVPPLALALGLGFLIGLGVLFAWRRGRDDVGGGAARDKVLAVLPFENLGAAQDEYFADGLADAVRGKLASLAGVEVIARESSAPYRKTSKPPEQVARELGAQYLLTGTVRWEKRPGGEGRVLVSPELVEVTPGRAPRARWQQPFAAALTDVFQVQGQIAGQVAEALDVALASSQLRALEARPTANPTAYDYYLRGNVYFERGGEPNVRAAEDMYAKAVALDTTFAIAYAQLARTHDNLYWFTYDRTPERLAKEKAAAERALQLRPDLAEAHLALGFYHYHGHLDYEPALEEFEVARRLQPSNADVYFAVGAVRRRQGRWAEAIRDLRHAVELNPRSITNLGDLATAYVSLRAYPDAESTLVRAMEIAPDHGQVNGWKAVLPLLWRGDTLEAERRMREALARAGAERALRSLFQPRFMVSSGIQSALYDTALVHESRAAFGSDTALYFRWRAGFHAYHGRPKAARAYFDSTRVVLERLVASQPEEPRFHMRLALVYDNLGRPAEAKREAQRAVVLGPVSQDALAGAGYREVLARMLVRTGEAEAALDQLAYLLSVPSTTSVAFLRIDPEFAPLRGNPRFERLVGGT